MSKLRILCLSVLSLLLTQKAYAQSGSDFWLWSDIGALVTLPDQTVSFSVVYRYIMDNDASEYFLQAGSALLSYRFPQTRFQIIGSYNVGEINDFGIVHLPQIQVRWDFSNISWHPSIQFTYGRLTINTLTDMPAYATNHRFRVQVGMAPPLASFLTLIVNTEPFIKTRDGWWAEQRSIVGFDWKLHKSFHLRTFYFNRWVNDGVSRFRWNHALMLGMRFYINPPHLVHRNSPHNW